MDTNRQNQPNASNPAHPAHPAITDFRFSSLDTVLSAAMVGAMAVGCFALLASQGLQSFVA